MNVLHRKRRALPNPLRRITSPGTMAHYWHTDTGKYLGTEVAEGNVLTQERWFWPPERPDDFVCPCLECEGERRLTTRKEQ